MIWRAARVHSADGELGRLKVEAYLRHLQKLPADTDPPPNLEDLAPPAKLPPIDPNNPDWNPYPGKDKTKLSLSKCAFPDHGKQGSTQAHDSCCSD